VADLTITDLQTADPLRATLEGRAVLDGVPCVLTLAMNSRSFRWFLDLRSTAGQFWVQGHALVSLADVLAVYRPLWPDMPPGVLYCAAVARDGSDPVGFGAWRTTHVLRYRPVADVA